MDVITTHINADFDAVASMVAAKKLYPNAELVFSGSQEKSVRDFLSSSPVTVEFKKLRDIALEEVTRLILVDVNKRDRIGRFAELLDRDGMTVHIYDTHPPAAGSIRAQKEVIDHVSATTTLFVEILQKRKRKISPVEATILALGIYEETGSLMFSSTTARDISAAAYLVKKGANLNVVSSFISRELEAEEIALLNELVQSSSDHVIHGIRIKIAKASRETYMGDIAFLAHKFRDSDDIDVIFLLVMMEDRVHVIARSRVAEADLSKILEPLGGGGHPAAASGVIKGRSLEETEETLLGILKERIKPAKTAKDIMTRPVKSISHDDTIRSAERTLTRYGVNVLPVIKDDFYRGIISREVVEKALFHGFGRSKVSEFCTTDALTVAQDTPMNEVEALMVEQNQRFMPVIENRRITGAITRTDLLRSLYEDILRKSRIGEEPLQEKALAGRNLLSIMKERLPADIFSLLTLSGEVAKQLSFSAYLVGGCVRDLLRGEENLDIDIVVEGDGIRFARSLGRRLGARVKGHSRFGTAIVMKGGLKFDVATARTEYYESPGVLPQVEMSSIKKDLYRRDFTINTLAIKLNPEDFGQLIDFFGGQRDLKERTIRILHNLSFIEDPTRAFRAIRFSERFGFNISKHTKNLIKSAVKINLFDKLSGTRLYDELNLLFVETEPIEAMKRLLEFDLLKFIHPDVVISRALEETFRDIQETYAWFKLLFLEEEINKSHLFLMALIEGLKPEDRIKVLQRLAVPKKPREEMLESIEQSKKTLTELQSTSWQEKDIYYALHPLNLQTVLFVIARSKDKKQKKALSSYLTTLRKIKPSLTGKDLKKLGYAPGPLFNRILRAVLDARLNGQVRSKEEEIKFVKKEFPV